MSAEGPFPDGADRRHDRDLDPHLAAYLERLAARQSIRGYLNRPIPRADLETLFAAAQRAPSWCNVQPWRVAVTEPPRTGTLAKTLVAAAKAGLPSPDVPFPLDYPAPYLAHRRECGIALYTAMGISRDNKLGRYDAWLRNYVFFDAPHLAVVSRDRRLGEYATLDVGVWLGVLVATAATMGIDLCPMAAVAAYPATLRAELNIDPEQMILFGIALGYRDPDVPANTGRVGRSPLGDNVRFCSE